MGLLGLKAMHPKPKLSHPGEGHKLYPYLLNGVPITRVNQMWSTEITYIRDQSARRAGAEGVPQEDRRQQRRDADQPSP